MKAKRPPRNGSKATAVAAARANLSLRKFKVPLVNISVVEGRPAELPCDITPPGEDTLHMVFWFKDEAGVPLYTALFPGTKRRRSRIYGHVLSAHVVYLYSSQDVESTIAASLVSRDHTASRGPNGDDICRCK
ncbi:hypothetical protein ALC53_05009 [Atta colombica]|uniref:Ig-like domain-containing protein n=1 Tax=Atta colombica TaxID=520822 RepID=A0A151I4W1_9HYME|nr:hypothetical protein ALC53_05009 [Atta colombica]